ncbi:acylphosphatase [Candidatus Woesearchaeota archaeon]|nr:acylphosphatase [Candidatus Woesearchaeota archaeon]
MVIKVVIKGDVQGVFFRAFVKAHAVRLGVRGHVRNLPTGDVEAVFAGEKAAVEKLIALCRTGPSGAHVDEVIASETTEKSSPVFEIK